MSSTSNLIYPCSIQNIERNANFDNALACLHSAGIRDQHILDIYLKHFITPSRALQLTSAVSRAIDLTTINDVVEEVRNHLQHLSPLAFAIQYHRQVVKKTPNISGLFGYIEKSILHVQHQAEKEKLLIIDASPSLLPQCKSDDAEIVFTYTNSDICQTIQQDQISNECTLLTWDCIEDWGFNRCIVFAFGNNNQVLETVSQLTTKCPKNTVVHIVVPNTLWDDSKTRATLCRMFALQKLVLFDPTAVPENPKKWCIATLINSTLDAPTHINLLDLKLNGDGTQLCGDKYIAVPYQTFQAGAESIKKLYTVYSKKKSPRNQPQVVSFSAELQFYMTFYQEQGLHRMQITFRGSEQTEVDKSAQGNQLARFGGPLRSSESEAFIPLTDLLFQENSFAMNVRKHANYLLTKSDLTIKTCWFIFYPTFSKMSRYNHNLMSHVFADQESGLSALTANASFEAVYEAVERFCGADEDMYLILEQLNLIYQQLFQLRLIAKNPIYAKLHQIKKAKRDIANTRHRIKTHTLSTEQEYKAFQLLQDDKTEPLLAFGAEIIANSPLSAAEVCGLLWANYTYDKEKNLGLLQIVQRVDRSGVLLPVNKPWFFPLPDSLCAKINALYLEEKKSSEFDPESTYIVHPYAETGSRPSVNAMNSYLQNLLQELPSYEKILMLKGDAPSEIDIYELTNRAFKNSFLSYCSVNARISEDEIQYLSGNAGKTVDARNYEDFNTIYSLNLIRQHLNIALKRRSEYV